jgi:hypothetical protein
LEKLLVIIGIKKMITAYATADKGEGRVMEIGQFEGVEDIEIIVGMFDKDTIITFFEKND